ncbi:hypothetical protein BS78_01G450200 [Paspalum vaginatum]|nr:hypothetical protein BS78_01G450200 [Paspalum vaginatum]
MSVAASAKSYAGNSSSFNAPAAFPAPQASVRRTSLAASAEPYSAESSAFNAPAAFPAPQASMPRRSLAASAEPYAADSSAYLRSMLLGDLSAPTPRGQTTTPQPPQASGPTTRADDDFLRQLQDLKLSSAPGAGYASLFNAPGAGYASLFNAPGAALTSTVAPNLSAGDLGHVAPSRSLVSQYTSTPSASASRFQAMPGDPHHQLGHAALPALDHHHGSGLGLNPYASAFQSTLQAANPLELDPYRCRYMSLGQVRSLLYRCPMQPLLLMFPETTAHVVRLLEEGDELVRRSVLLAVKGDAKVVMGSDEKHAVLVALVHACAGRPDELREIVKAMCCTSVFVMCVARDTNGSTTLKHLMAAVAPHPQLIDRFIRWLLRQRLLEQYNGTELLRYSFTILPYERSKIIIEHAITHIGELLFSTYGSRSLADCFKHARNDELRAFEEIILKHTDMIATGPYSNYFLQQAIEHGSDSLQVAISGRVAADLVRVCSSQFGSYVVEACFLHTRTPAPLQVVLSAFLGLSPDDLVNMVKGRYSNYVVSKLLASSKRHLPQEARMLARRIESIPEAAQSEMHARGVMAVVKKMCRR